ncbi:molybdopterin-dependent oxidoreductase [Antarcticimicrobium sediminis]|uniref:2Fe-2S iron-sulfur cluster binding domain-containing protein n=1 Tax=Antarcticimicrobium sediminis TaxID=2546227 RepID=A0A4R5EVN6_9RHOB|nr:molybdopterin cofactor-binding domain-containing protein [Antarcticimicrobium sediminis]TDE38964.1 2Fe-2S iron-sulfur cluster binding domain-containing protein [Antarcticimicrobium sediminis]
MKDIPTLTLTVNGAATQIDTAPGRRLSEVLRDGLGLTGTKVGCDAGDCGACTVLLDGAPVCACLTPAIHAEGAEITTVEGLGAPVERLKSAFLRHGAAQCGICTPGMLMAAAALLARPGPPPDRSDAEAALGGVLCRCTGYAKIIDAVLDAAGVTPQAVTAAAPASGAAVGARLERLDGAPKVAGTEIFGADYAPAGALWVRAIRSPHFAASFTFGDLDAFAAQTGLRVFTAADIPGQNVFGTIPAFADQPALAEGAVRMRGEAVALVAGDKTTLEAFAPDSFPITWSPQSEILDCATARTPEAPRLHEAREGNILISGLVHCGDPVAGFASAAHVAEGAAETPYVEHAYIEPEAGAAWLEGDTLVIQACTQAPVMDRDDTARVLGLPPERVRIIPSATGGGFGSKLDLSVQPLIGLVALKTGLPARMTYSRRESMSSTTKRHPARMRARAAVDADGRLTAMEFDGDFNTGAYASWGPTVAVRVPVHASGPYSIPNYHAEARAVHTNGPVSGAFRGFGVPQAAILQETLFDDLALKAGIDRLAFRRLNALPEGGRSVCGQELHGVGIGICLDALKPRWEAAAQEATAFNATQTGRKRGIGVASCWYGCGNTALPNPSTVRLGLTPEGRLRLHQGATDIGQGSNTVIPQICADALGLPVQAFELIGPDTALTPDCGKTSASRQTVVTGNAALRAGETLRARILALSNMGQGAQIALAPGAVLVTEGEQQRRIDLAALDVDANGYALAAEETYDPPTKPLDENGQGTPFAVYGYGAHLAEVEVDLALGTVRVHRLTAAHDLGRVINPLLAEGQIEGGVAQGLGLALMEDYIPGRTENLHDYLIPTAGDMPRIDTILLEATDPEGPFGAKGLGEHALIPTAPAILNAIRDACGAKVTRLPALPHRVLAAIRAAEQTP